MSDWNAGHYLKYGQQRTRAATDLVARVQLDQPATIFDLGCGPGNSTQRLRQHWPHSEVLGIDHSKQMIDVAKDSYPNQQWIIADIHTWSADMPVDLVYSNAALHWLANHDVLVPRLFAQVASGGALAFQIPSRTFPKVRELIHGVSRDPAWTERMERPRNLLTMHSPSFYYDILSGEAASLDIWETEYHHVVESTSAIVDWMASTGLRPFLAALDSDHEREGFVDQLQAKVDEAYEIRIDGRVLFPFRRTFVVAYR
jgi:trans-aconitate 2-methyltransferase